MERFYSKVNQTVHNRNLIRSSINAEEKAEAELEKKTARDNDNRIRKCEWSMLDKCILVSVYLFHGILYRYISHNYIGKSSNCDFQYHRIMDNLM